VINQTGFYDLGFEANSYVWIPGNTGCCITFCANTTTAFGYWCQTRYQPKASGSFPRLYVWCGDDKKNANETCS
jgi:hypothetical protein